MTAFDFEIYNVFAETAWGGNPLAIVPNADELSSVQMQRIARQFNLSETVFICHSSECAASLRIFTPDHEMPFAGHPTIGAAAWLHQHHALPDVFTLQTPAKVVQIQHESGLYDFALSGYESQPCALTRNTLATALSLSPSDVADNAFWMNAGTWQLIVPLTNVQAIQRVCPNLHVLRDSAVEAVHMNVYVWHEANNEVHSRYFFNIDNAVIEDSGTGSACANLGAWAHLHQRAPLSWRITQAEFINRPNRLYLQVHTDGQIQVGGRVQPFAQGRLFLPQ